MNKLFVFILLLFFYSCSKDKDNLVDVNSFLKEGNKVELTNNNNLIDEDSDSVSKIQTGYKSIIYKSWKQTNSNERNFLQPTIVDIENKPTSIPGSYQKVLSYRDNLITINSKSEIQIINTFLKKKISKKIYDRKIYKKNKIQFKLAIDRDKIIVSDNLGNIHALNYNNLNIIWIKKLNVPFKSEIKIYKDNIYLINSNSKIYSIDLNTGNINWSFETASKNIKDESSYQIAIFQNKLFFTNDSAEIYCLDLENNQIKWSFVFQPKDFYKEPISFKSSPITIDPDGKLYLSTNYGYTYKIDSLNGSIDWSIPILTNNNISVLKNYILFTESNRLIILNKKNGKILKNKKINLNKNNNNIFFNKIFVGSNYIYLFNKNGILAYINLKNLNNVKIKKISKSFEGFILNKKKIIILSNRKILIF